MWLRRTSGVRPMAATTSSWTFFMVRILLRGAAPAPPAGPSGAGRAAGSGLAVPVVGRLQPADDADAAQRDLARARVVGDVVRLARAVRQVAQRLAAGAEGVGHAGPRWAGDQVPAPDGALLVAEPDDPLPAEDDEDLLLGRVAVRWPAGRSRGEDDVVQPGAYRAARLPECAEGHAGPAVLDDARWEGVTRHDIGRARPGRGELERPRGRVVLPQNLRAGGRDDRRAGVGQAGARQVADLDG